ncbi:hypothetical protein BH11ARM2_BH11ARM2_09370 [soil metagenome]
MTNTTECRALREGELPDAVRLWTEVFDVESDFFTSLLEGGEPGEGLSYGAFAGGRIVSSVHVFMRLIRDREGRPMKVGGIGSVSTHPDFRKQGLSGRLLELAVAGMEEAGCVWSFLGTGVNDHYARYGWRTVSTPDLTGDLLPNAEGDVRTLTPDDATLDEMARLYEPFAAARPMAHVRSPRAWRTALLYRLDPVRAGIFGSFDGDRLVAYLVAIGSGDHRGFIDAACEPGEEGRFPGLFAGAAGRLWEDGVRKASCALPEWAGLLDAYRTVVPEPVPGEHRGAMLRPIADRIGWADLLALYGDPRGRQSNLDAF